MLVNKINTFLKNSVCFIFSVVLCFSLVTSFALSANAAPVPGTSSSPVTKGEANLNDIQQKTDDLAQQEPPSLKDVIKNTEGGLNEVQGKADIGQMNNPGNSQDATTVEEKFKELFGKATDKK